MAERLQSYLLPTIAPMANIIAKPPTRKGSYRRRFYRRFGYIGPQSLNPRNLACPGSL